jgi:hypothetical protein
MRRSLLLMVGAALAFNNACTDDDDFVPTDARRDQAGDTAGDVPRDMVAMEAGSEVSVDAGSEARDVSAETGTDAPVDQPPDQPDAAPDGPLPDTTLADGPDASDADVSPPADVPDMMVEHDLASEPVINPACGGGAMLNDICDAYCGAVTTTCTGPNAQFATMQDCLTACNLPTWSCGEPGEMTGNSVFCRLGNAALASADAKACAGAGPNSSICQ